MSLVRRLRRRLLAGALITGLMFQPSAARAEPITIAAFGSAFAATFAGQVVTFVITTAITIGLNKLLAPGIKSNRQAQVAALQIGEQPRNALIGEVAHAGSLLDGFNYGGKNGTDWEMVIIAVADHRCHSLSGYFVNDKYVSHAGNGTVPGYNGQLKVWFLPGTETQALPSELLLNCPMLADGVTRSWTADDNCAGIALFIAAYKADKSSAKKPIWSAGRPQFLPVVKGAYLYDPRKDSTVPGGSGAHRWTNPATWEWSDNLAIGRYNWLRGFYACDRVGQADMLLVGRGLSAVEAPPERVFAAANLCDEIAEDGQKRWRCDAVIYATDRFIDTEETFAAACSGQIVQREGGVEVVPGHAQSVVMEISDDDLLIDAPVEYEMERGDRDDEWVNTVVGRYIEPSMKWSDHAAPVRRVVSDVTADRKPREATLSLQFVSRVNQAQYAAEYKRRLGRLWATGTIPLGPRFMGLEEGDWIGWTSARRFGGRKVFRIDSWSFDRTRKSKRVLREIAASVYDPVTLYVDQSVANQPLPPDLDTAPDAGAWTLTGSIVASNGTQVPTLNFAGAVEDDSASAVIFDYAAGASAPDPDDDALWTNAGSGYTSITEFTVPGLSASATYWGAVSYLVGASRTDRRVLGPVTFNSAAVQPGSPTLLTKVSQTDDTATISARAPEYAPFEYLRFYAGSTAVFADAVAISGELVCGTGEVVQITETAIQAGPRYYWAVAYSSSDVASTPTGPLALNIGGVDFSGGTLPANVSFSRSSAAMRTNVSGTLVSEANNVARFDYDRTSHALLGILIEPTGTNGAPNNTAQGAVTGVIGSGGALPTGHSISAANGMTRTVTAIGVVDGIDTYSVRFNGTATSAAALTMRLDDLSTETAGSQWTNSVYLALDAGSLTNVAGFQLRAGDEAGGTTISALAATLQRFTNTRVLASTAPRQTLRWNYAAIGAVVDFTLRIGLPQREAGAQATSPIRTTGAAATRAADVLTINWGARHVPDGSITVRYTFDDGSTQDVATTVASGLAVVPTNLNRSRIRKLERI